MSIKLTRREWNNLALTGLAGLFVPSIFSSCSPKTNMGMTASGAENLGVVLGAQTYSFRDRPLDEAIKAMQQLGIRTCELWEGHVEPRKLQWAAGETKNDAKSKAERIKAWRDNLDLAEIRAIKSKFDAAGITIMAYTATIKDNARDKDIELAFKIAEALGTGTINSSATVNVMKRIDPFAQKYKIKVAMHNHSHTDKPNEISSPESFERGMAGLSDYININLDIGHFTAANFDAVDYMKKHHDRILSIHLKDRKKNQGPNMPFGEGDTPIIEVLKLIRDNKWPIVANIEYEYKGAGTSVEEVKKCLDYCERGLKS